MRCLRMQGKGGFTLVELLVVISIIAVLVGLLLPALGRARTMARVTELKTKISGIETGLETFRSDMGYYPESKMRTDTGNYSDYSDEVGLVNQNDPDYPDQGNVTTTAFVDMGAHRLAEAMFGIDQLGFSPPSTGDGLYGWYEVEESDPDHLGEPIDIEGNYISRKGPYVAPANLDIGIMNDVREKIHESLQLSDAADTEVSIDENNLVWGQNLNPVILDQTSRKYPSPILYFKARRSANLMHDIYDYRDNGSILYGYMMDTRMDRDTNEGVLADYGEGTEADTRNYFQDYVWDPTTGTGDDPMQSPTARPYNRDSFILMSAGPDGEFGTDDDVTNFQRKTN